MSRNAWLYRDPYEGLAASVVTSHILDTRDAFDQSISWYTTAGSTSTFTVQLSNHSARIGIGSEGSAIAEASWSNFTTVTPSGSSFMQPPLGFRYLRILRTVSGASLVFNTQKQIR